MLNISNKFLKRKTLNALPEKHDFHEQLFKKYVPSRIIAFLKIDIPYSAYFRNKKMYQTLQIQIISRP